MSVRGFDHVAIPIERVDAMLAGGKAQAEAGNAKLVRGAWNAAFIDEAAHFPNSDYADQIDAASRAFHRLTGTRRRGVSTVAPISSSSRRSSGAGPDVRRPGDSC